ncbi:MAG: bifunctional diaminohydroxyphosphoribosylaminopyrimidine deaminase/5-amino-6-(5-phosphoribosylamino)uracil reductase RibD [Candidatus Binatia bacterium]|nr:bifunctional diaminohydroxyphosphoribosylaminopyrimidine deaminase/5-amino-6-(5-phosphoribosylamino)uracil reductase RibD [Candidatus Binatia bacterium]
MAAKPRSGEALDARYMHRALTLAKRGLGRTHPNPPVGAVLVRRGEVVGQGWHHRAGEPHAEALAFAAAGKRARGATLYCTLEPCTVEGRTPACAPAVIDAGVARVVLGSVDTDRRVAGRGIRRIRRAGIDVTTGVETAACDELLRFYDRHRRAGRPWVRLKLATSLDGRIALRDGTSKWITGDAARAEVHRWRDQLDAVLVGSGTVRADDPTLDCRRPRGRDPIRVVADSRLRTLPTARLFQAGDAPVWLVTTKEASEGRARRLEAAGGDILRVKAREGRVDPRALLQALGRRGVTSVLAEGGSTLAASLLRAGLVDELCVFQAPLLIGGDGIPMIQALGIESLAKAPRLGDVRVSRVGVDTLWTARLPTEG